MMLNRANLLAGTSGYELAYQTAVGRLGPSNRILPRSSASLPINPNDRLRLDLVGGRGPASGRPLPASRLMARTAMSWSHGIWQLSRTPDKPRAAKRSFSA